MNKHTPGPWEFCTRLQPSENHRGYYIKSKKFVVAFEVIPVDQDGKEGEANARLIAAAPELLEALTNLVAVRAGEGGTKFDADEIARAAIAKATGAA